MSPKPQPKKPIISALSGITPPDDFLSEHALVGVKPTGFQMLKAIIGQGGNKLSALASLPEAPSEAANEALTPSAKEAERVGELMNAFFGEFGTASRSYAFARHSDNMTPDIEAFMQNPNPDVEPAELRKIGWESFRQLMTDLSTPVMQMQAARRATPVDDLESADIKSETARRIRDTKILPLLKRYNDAHGLFDLGASDSSRLEDTKAQIPGFAMVVEAMMHDVKSSGLHYALNKKTNGEKLTEKDIKLLTDNADIVETAESMLASAGMGWATKPCNQIYSAAGRASEHWTNYMKEEQQGRFAERDGSPFIAKTHFEAAMGHHAQTLKEYKAIHAGLTPICELVSSMIDSNGKTTLTNEALDKTSALVGTMPDIATEQRIVFNVSRIRNAVERVLKREHSAIPAIESYVIRNQHVGAFAETTRPLTQKIVKQIGELKEAIKGTNGSMAISDPKFRDVYMGVRGMTDRLEMMVMAAEQLHTDMGKITGKQNPEWAAKETEGEKKQFEVPANPSELVKRVAEEIQRNCLVQHEVAVKRRAELLEMVQEIGGSVDRFDVIHDFYARMQKQVGEQIADMQVRQDKWDAAHPAAGASKAV